MNIQIRKEALSYVLQANDIGKKRPLIEIRARSAEAAAKMRVEMCLNHCLARGIVGFACTEMYAESQVASIYDSTGKMSASSSIYAEVVGKALCVEEVAEDK